MLNRSKSDKHKNKSSNEEKYPKLVNGSAFGIFQRLMARLGMARIRDQLFLGYCTIHSKYFSDFKHTNDTIRCPICDSQWLREHGLVKKLIKSLT